MPARESLCSLIGINPQKFSKGELTLLEAEIFVHMCYELLNFLMKDYAGYVSSKNINKDLENHMLEHDFIRLMIHDILASGDYTLEGIAYYTDIHEDVLCELASGLISKPLAHYLLKIIELHKLVRKELYSAIREKLIKALSGAA